MSIYRKDHIRSVTTVLTAFLKTRAIMSEKIATDEIIKIIDSAVDTPLSASEAIMVANIVHECFDNK